MVCSRPMAVRIVSCGSVNRDCAETRNESEEPVLTYSSETQVLEPLCLWQASMGVAQGGSVSRSR
jgi:hypothetical protein